MAESIVSDVVVRLLDYLTQSIVEVIAPYFGGRKKLNRLRGTVVLIQARLFDAERLREGERGESIKQWLKSLKSVLYMLEDLLEEMALVDRQNEGGVPSSFTKIACCLPSKLSCLEMNRRVAQEAEDVMRELESLKEDMHILQLRAATADTVHLTNIREETDCFIREEEVIGRDEDKKAIVQMLLNSDHTEDNISVIVIVGMGGLGKTALAQLAYGDKIVQESFDFKWWACISDHISTTKELAGRIVQAVTGFKGHQSSIEEVQSQLREAVKNKKFLLVLDDVWDEDRERWLRLRRWLCEAHRGSKILVTSRSEVVASNMSTLEPYELRGLPEDKSWVLFQSLAFGEGQEEANPNLTTIGRDVVTNCANVPLADLLLGVRTVAGILFSKDTEEEWVQFRDCESRMMEPSENKIMSTLKLSYDHLPPLLKQCFAYCSLFPKDYEFEIKRLIWLWLAQGFVRSLENQVPHDVGHVYFVQLLRKCFFQDVKRDSYGRMVSCKMQDLMHDLAKEVGNGCLLVEEIALHPYMCDHIFHGSIPCQNLNEVFSCLCHLRALDFGWIEHERLPDSIGELKHLRYLSACVRHLPKRDHKVAVLAEFDSSRFLLPQTNCQLASPN